MFQQNFRIRTAEVFGSAVVVVVVSKMLSQSILDISLSFLAASLPCASRVLWALLLTILFSRWSSLMLSRISPYSIVASEWLCYCGLLQCWHLLRLHWLLLLRLLSCWSLELVADVDQTSPEFVPVGQFRSLWWWCRVFCFGVADLENDRVVVRWAFLNYVDIHWLPGFPCFGYVINFWDFSVGVESRQGRSKDGDVVHVFSISQFVMLSVLWHCSHFPIFYNLKCLLYVLPMYCMAYRRGQSERSRLRISSNNSSLMWNLPYWSVFSCDDEFPEFLTEVIMLWILINSNTLFGLCCITFKKP